MKNFISPLVTLTDARRPTFEVGDLVTVELFSSDGPVRSGARVTRIERGDVWVRLAGLTVPEPYEIGMPLTLDLDKVVDW